MGMGTLWEGVPTPTFCRVVCQWKRQRIQHILHGLSITNLINWGLPAQRGPLVLLALSGAPSHLTPGRFVHGSLQTTGWDVADCPDLGGLTNSLPSHPVLGDAQWSLNLQRSFSQRQLINVPLDINAHQTSAFGIRGINRVGVNFHRMLGGALDEILALFGQFCNGSFSSSCLSFHLGDCLCHDGIWVGTHKLADLLGATLLEFAPSPSGPSSDNDFVPIPL